MEETVASENTKKPHLSASIHLEGRRFECKLSSDRNLRWTARGCWHQAPSAHLSPTHSPCKARCNFGELPSPVGLGVRFSGWEALPSSWMCSPNSKHLCETSRVFPEAPQNLPEFLHIFQGTQIHPDWSVKSYFPVLCSYLMSRLLCNLPRRTFWSTMYFLPPPQPAQPASGTNPDTYIPKLCCQHSVQAQIQAVLAFSSEEEPPKKVRSAAKSTYPAASLGAIQA